MREEGRGEGEREGEWEREGGEVVLVDWSLCNISSHTCMMYVTVYTYTCILSMRPGNSG